MIWNHIWILNVFYEAHAVASIPMQRAAVATQALQTVYSLRIVCGIRNFVSIRWVFTTLSSNFRSFYPSHSSAIASSPIGYVRAYWCIFCCVKFLSTDKWLDDQIAFWFEFASRWQIAATVCVRIYLHWSCSGTCVCLQIINIMLAA